MLVEFLGVPGTGKTTLTSMVVQNMQAWGVQSLSVIGAIRVYAARTLRGRLICRFVPGSLQRPALWRVYSWFRPLYRLQFAGEHPEFWRYVARSQQERPIPQEHRQLIWRHFGDVVASYQFLSRQMRPGETLVYDEGFTHRVVNLYVSEQEQPEPDRIVQYLAQAPTSDLVILVHAPLSICVQRVWTRGVRGRLGGTSEQEVTRFLENAQRAVSISAAYLQSSGRAMIEVDNGGGLEPCAADLVNQLKEFLAVQPSRIHNA
jgi:adenylate kinase